MKYTIRTLLFKRCYAKVCKMLNKEKSDALLFRREQQFDSNSSHFASVDRDKGCGF